MIPPGLPPTDLRCNSLSDPLAIRHGAPVFTWVLDGASGSRSSHDYQILVATDSMALERGRGDAWDSGRKAGSGASGVVYAGRALEPLERYVWKVRIWCDAERPSAWSGVASFEVGMGDTERWSASWISWNDRVLPFEAATDAGPVDPVALGLSPVPYLRREFVVADDVTCARLYVTARGLYEARINGERVGDAVLTPGWTDYSRRLQYRAYDVTAMLHPGDNAIGVMLGDGWYSGYFGFEPKRSGAHYGDHPELLAQLLLYSSDGNRTWIVTDSSWRTNWGAILHADPLMGELQCPAVEPAGWDRAGFDDRGWYVPAVRATDGTTIVADPGPPIRVIETVPPRQILPLEHGGVIVDFGQNLTGWVRLEVDAARGKAIRLRHGEMLDNDGRLYVDNLRTARQTDELWTSGGTQVFEPHFTWHGFRYVEVTGHPGALAPGSIAARVVHSDMDVTGTFECGDPIVNKLHANIDWGLRSNFLSVPTDCPQRDERLGWLGDAQIFARTATYLRDVLAFFDKWLDDVVDAQRGTGAFTDVAPRLGLEWAGAPGWGDAGVIVPWTLYKMYGAVQPAARCYDAMTRWMEFLSRGNPDRLRTQDLGNNYGDWLAPGRDETPRELLATAYWAYDATLMAEMAEGLGREVDARDYRQLAGSITDAFVEAFVDDDGRLASGTQTSYALALFMDLVPDHLRDRAADHLVEAIRERDWHLSTGFVGVGYLLPVLSSRGYSAVAYRLLAQESLPSWRYPIRHGATTIWERWDGWTETKGFQSPFMNSFNHYSLGSVGEWLYRFVAGIDQAANSFGFERPVLRPHPDGSLTWAGATLRSRRGSISSRWRLDGETLVIDVAVPPGVTADVHVPSSNPAATGAGGGITPTRVGRFCGRRGMGEAIFEVGPGTHHITAPYTHHAWADPPAQ